MYLQFPLKPKKKYTVQTDTEVYYDHLELPFEEKSKIKFKKHKFSLSLKLEVCGLKT